MTDANSKENVEMLLKEALLLSGQIAQMDKKIEADMRASNGKLACLIHDFVSPAAAKTAGLVVGYGKDKVEEKIKVELIKILAKAAGVAIPTLEKGAKIGGGIVSVIVGVFEIGNKGTKWQKETTYFESPVGFQTGVDYNAKVTRLAEITRVLVTAAPLQSWDLKNTCPIQQCYMSARK